MALHERLKVLMRPSQTPASRWKVCLARTPGLTHAVIQLFVAQPGGRASCRCRQPCRCRDRLLQPFPRGQRCAAPHQSVQGFVGNCREALLQTTLLEFQNGSLLLLDRGRNMDSMASRGDTRVATLTIQGIWELLAEESKPAA